MKIAIIGAGFAGLSASFELAKKGNEVFIFEKDKYAGGLAIGYKEKAWEWSLEKHYHHWFTNDKYILNLAKEINHKVIIKRPLTSIINKNKIYKFDSPKDVITFPNISYLDRFRMGFVLAIIKFNPIWMPLEKINATKLLPKLMGTKGYKTIWEPLFKNKFGPFAENVSLAWFWARIVKRTPSLAYPKGGFLSFANHLIKKIKSYGAQFYFKTEVLEVSRDCVVKFKTKNGKIEFKKFDKVIFTLPSFMLLKTVPEFSKEYKKSFSKLNGIGATNLILRLKKPFFNNHTYWLSVCDETSPIMAIVEHTNFMDKKNYNNEHIVYLGNYLPKDSKRFNMDKKETLNLFDKYLTKINPDYKKNIISYELFKAPFAQPIIPTNYSELIPQIKTEFENIYLANIEQVYPWDRGTNYAVELGQKVAKLVQDEKII